MLRALLLPVLLALSTVAAHSQAAARIEPLYDALRMTEVVEIMREEGIDYSEDLAAELFPGAGGEAWSDLVDEIYAVPRLERIVRDALARELEGADIDAMVAFFDSPLGRRIVGLENTARRALLSEDVDADSRAMLAEMIDAGDPRLDLIERFAETNRLIENNVVGAMNSNYAFYRGLSDGGAFDRSFTDEDMLADVWSQEEVIRDDTVEWLYSYLALAYRPLTDEEIGEYIAFSETEPGAELNQAVFDAFDEMFVSVSLALGHAAARFLSSQEL